MTATIVSRLILNLHDLDRRVYSSESGPTTNLQTSLTSSFRETAQLSTQISRYSSWIVKTVDEFEPDLRFMSSLHPDSIEGHMEGFPEHELNLLKQEENLTNQSTGQMGANQETHFVPQRIEENHIMT